MAALRSSVQPAALVLGLLALVALAPAGVAQIMDPTASVQLGQSTLDLGAANVTTVVASVSGTSQNAGTVAVSVTAPEGWTVVADPSSFAAPGGQDVTLTITAPDAGAGAAAGDVVVTAVTTEAAPTSRSSAPATATLGVTRVDPLPPPPPPTPWYQTTGGIAAIVVAVLLVAGAVVGIVLHRRRKAARAAAEAAAAAAAARAAYLDRETGVKVALHEAPRQFGPKRELVFRVQVENVSQRPRVAVLRVEATPGWTGAPQLPRIPLSPGEKSTVTVAVSAGPDVASEGKADVVVIARPEEAQELDERFTIPIEAPAVRRAPTGELHVEGMQFRTYANTRPPSRG